MAESRPGLILAGPARQPVRSRCDSGPAANPRFGTHERRRLGVELGSPEPQVLGSHERARLEDGSPRKPRKAKRGHVGVPPGSADGASGRAIGPRPRRDASVAGADQGLALIGKRDSEPGPSLAGRPGLGKVSG
jgi:hypothetical protein